MELCILMYAAFLELPGLTVICLLALIPFLFKYTFYIFINTRRKRSYSIEMLDLLNFKSM